MCECSQSRFLSVGAIARVLPSSLLVASVPTHLLRTCAPCGLSGAAPPRLGATTRSPRVSRARARARFTCCTLPPLPPRRVTSRRPEPRTRSRPRPRARARILLRRRLFFLRHRLGLGPQLNRAPVTLTSNIQKIEYNLGIHLLQLLTEPLPTFICMYAHFTLPRFLSGPLRTSE